MKKIASKNQIKEWKKLQMGKYRKKYGLFLAEGIRCVEQILQNGLVEVMAVLTDGSDALQLINVKTVPVYELLAEDFAAISDTQTPQGVIAVCRMPVEVTPDELIQNDGVIVALDAIQDPGNLGTIIRNAAWFGAKALVFGTGCVDPFHPKVVRSTAGATGSLPYLNGSLNQFFNQFENYGWRTYLLDAGEEAHELSTIKPESKSIIVAGNEANGIQHSLFQPFRKRVKITGKTTHVESLNAAMAMGISLYSFTRTLD